MGSKRSLYISLRCLDMGPSQGSKVLGLEQVGLRWTLGGSAGDRDMVPSSVYVLHQLCVHKQPTAGRHVHAFHWWIPGRYFTKKSHQGNGVAVRSLARRQCSPGSIPARCHMWAEFVVDSRLAPRVFLRGFRFSSLHENQHFQIPIRPE